MIEFNPSILPASTGWTCAGGIAVSGQGFLINGTGKASCIVDLSKQKYVPNHYRLTIPITSTNKPPKLNPTTFCRIHLTYENGYHQEVIRAITLNSYPGCIEFLFPSEQLNITAADVSIERLSTDIDLLLGEIELCPSKEVTQNETNVIIEVVEEKVIVAETAMIMSCWIDEANVQFFESNFKALDTRQPAPAGNMRYFTRIEDEHNQMLVQELSATETQDYTTHDGRQIYWTAIETHEQAYKYFTISDPLSLNKNLVEADREKFKVKIRKILSEKVKMSTDFEQITTPSGLSTVMPVQTWGEGTSGSGDNGKCKVFKDSDGMTLLQYYENTNDYCGIKLSSAKGCLKKDPTDTEWVPIGSGGSNEGPKILQFDHVPTEQELVEAKAMVGDIVITPETSKQ